MVAIPTEQVSLSSKLSEAVLVVAHPDDEILWFSSLLAEVAKIIVCFGAVPGQPDWTKGRAEVINKFPLKKTTFLNLTESVAFGVANWADPVESDDGLRLDRPDCAFNGFSAERYQQNFCELTAYLPSLIADYSTVVTHNPWGEYGHEEHVQVFRAVRAVCDHENKDVWYSNYVSDRSARLMIRTLARSQDHSETLTTRPDIAAPIEQLYREHNCWTWPYDNYEYFETETFVFDRLSVAGTGGVGNRLALNFLDVDGGLIRKVPRQTGPSVMRQRLRRLKRKLGRVHKTT